MPAFKVLKPASAFLQDDTIIIESVHNVIPIQMNRLAANSPPDSLGGR